MLPKASRMAMPIIDWSASAVSGNGSASSASDHQPVAQ
jgi:hypothetical protein